MDSNNRLGHTKLLSIDIRIAIYVYFVISIFEQYINGTIGSITKYYILLLCALLFICSKFALRYIAVPYILWLVYKISSLLWSTDYTTPRLHFISQIGMIMLLVIMLSINFDEETIEKIEMIYCVSSAILGVLAIFFSKSYHGISYSRQIVVLFGVEQDPNNMAALFIIGVSISLYNLLNKKKYRVISVIIILLNSYACLCTGSRAGLVTIASIILLFMMLSDKERSLKHFGRRILFIVAIVICAVYIINNYLPESVFVRLFDFSSYEGGSNRDILWNNAWSVYTRNFATVCFGVGWGTATANTGMAIHNTFLTMLCDVGLLGTALFVVPIIYAGIRLIKIKQVFPVVFLASQFIPAFFIDAINKRFFWNALIIFFIFYMKYSQLDKYNTAVRGNI